MKIRQIELNGFKSFGHQTRIHLGQGINGVVGPNGCGKSNIVDAVLWVMGETSPSHLRGDSMEDVIFAGAKSRNVAGRVEVSMVLEKSDCPFPEPYKNLSELMITRRLDRDGESEYLINSTASRLRDVQEVFMDTGVGRGGFGFIEQGAVENFIASRPEKKRVLIESAAGIAKFRLKKKEAERKLDLTAIHLNRLQDVLKQYASGLKKLKKQADEANTFRSLKKQREEQDIKISQWNLLEIKNKKELHTRRLQKETEAKHEIQSTLSRLKETMDKGQLSRRQILMDEEREKVEKCRRELFELDKKLATASAFLKAINEEGEITAPGSAVFKGDSAMQELKEAEGEAHILEKELKAIAEQLHPMTEDWQQKQKALWQLETLMLSLNAGPHSLKKEDDLWKKGEMYVLEWAKKRDDFKDAFKNLPVVFKRTMPSSVVKQAAELLFADRLRALFCKNKQAALEVRGDLKTGGMGCRFIFTDNYRKDLEINQALGKEPGFQFFLTDFMEGEYKKIFTHVAVVGSMEEAHRLKQKYADWAFITLAGDMIAHSGDWIIYDGTKLEAVTQNKDKKKAELRRQIEEQSVYFKKVTEKKNILENQKESLHKKQIALKEKTMLLEQALLREQEAKKISQKLCQTKSVHRRHKVDHYQKQIKILNTKKQQKTRELSELEAMFGQMKLDYNSLEQSFHTMQQDIMDQHQVMMNKDQVMGEIKLQQEVLLNREQALLDRIQELYQVDLVLPDGVLPESAIRAAAEEQLNALNRTLSNIGEVNLLALREYEEMQKKRDFYEKQYQDLCDSAKELQEVIKRMEQFCSKKFKTVFDSVNHFFAKVFPALFDGGRAELVLTKEGGVDVMVEPAGKKIQNMNLLSGGEKAMTALAVIFSLFMVKPSPFCILDEVDAPLDDANILRFCSLLLEMAKVCGQVVIITHNRRTMQVCHKLYGVTMEEKGVSKIFSLDMKKMQEKAT